MLIKSYMWQLMKSLDHMHKKGIFHRDIKPENILIESGSDMGRGLKLADFGSCRGIFSKQPYTEYISTRWYRAPECLLTDGYYGPEMDLWGAGCVMFEITSLYPLFPGTNEIDQATKIHKVLGTPSREMLQKFKSKAKLNSLISFEFPYQKGVGIPGLIPHASSECIDLIIKLLKYEAADRITAKEAMRHPYFRDIREFEKKTVHAVSNVTVVKEITKNPDLPDSKYNENDPTLKSQGQNNRITPDQMSSSQPKVLPNILDKGTGVMTGRVGVKHTTQHQNQQEKNNNVTYGKSYGGTAVAVSSLPPIALGASNSANNTINNKQVKPTWPPRRRKSKTGIIPIANAISSSSNSASMGAESFYTNHQIGSNTSSIKSSNTGGAGSGLTQQQAILKCQLTRAYGGNPPPRTVTGVGVGIGALKLGVKIEGNSPTGPLKDLLLNSKKIAV
jgi:serine/threonine protein kinase